MKPLRVQTQRGDVVELTRERCEAVMLTGEPCDGSDFRGPDGLALCWLHRKVVERGLRDVVVVEPLTKEEP